MLDADSDNDRVIDGVECGSLLLPGLWKNRSFRPMRITNCTIKQPAMITLVALLCLAPLLSVAAELSPSRFERVREIDGSFEAGQRGRLQLTGDVFGQARSFPNDLRIFDTDGTQWPFFLQVPPATSTAKTLTPEIRNRSFVAGDAPYLQFDLVVPLVDGKPPVHNQMELRVSGRDFVRRVEVFTGNPNQPSGHMASGYLIDFSRQRNAQNRTLRYPDSDAARLHVRIYSNAQAADETFDLVSAGLRHRKVVPVERETVGYTPLDVPEREQQTGAQTQLLDLGETGRPIEAIVFEVETPSYARSVSVYGRNTEHDPWRWVGGGQIHALAGDTETTVALTAETRFLKVHVFHYDDPPLAIASTRLEAIPRYLVFEAASAKPATLHFRAWDATAPRYDLKGRIPRESMAGLPIVQLRDAAPNAAAKTQPWRNYSKWIGGLVVGAVSLLVIWIIVSMLRQQRLAAGE